MAIGAVPEAKFFEWIVQRLKDKLSEGELRQLSHLLEQKNPGVETWIRERLDGWANQCCIELKDPVRWDFGMAPKILEKLKEEFT